MIKAGVKDMHACVETMVEVYQLLGQGDYVMGGKNHNSHGVKIVFPKTSPFPNMPLDGPDRRFMAMVAYLGGRFNVAGEKWVWLQHCQQAAEPAPLHPDGDAE